MNGLLHSGVVTHRRHIKPFYTFNYRVWMLSLDIDRSDEPGLRLFRRNRSWPVALHDADHGARDGTPLRPWVEQQLRSAGLEDCAAGIRFMVMPRVFGYAFNPIAFFFCHDAAGRLGAVLHQVRNTFGGQHTYVLGVAPHAATIHQASPKRMHVSPFFDMQGGYRFAFNRPDFTPGSRFRLRIRYGTAEAARLTATINLQAEQLTDAALMRQLLRMPAMTLKVMAAIHWEALKIWLRGARYHPLPSTKEETA